MSDKIEYTKCPKCGTEVYDENAGGMFMTILRCPNCRWTDNGSEDAFCDLATSD